MKKQRFRFSFIALLAVCVLPATASAHMPWLATDGDGHAVLWFGESPGDRTYHMPAPIAAIELTGSKSGDAITTAAVETDELVGLRSKAKADGGGEITGVVTYGLYHGTKLTYHVEHLPGDASQWPTEPRSGVAYQTVITPSPSGGVSVAVLADGKPVRDVEVQLFCDDGHVEGTATTDIAGMVTFDASEVEAGLNAISASITADNEGELNGAAYTSTTDMITATFMMPKSNSSPSEKTKPQSKKPTVDLNSGASIVPSGLPELPEELTSFGAAISGSKIYVYGGHTGSAHSYSVDEQSDRLWCLDMAANENASWQTIATGPRLQGLALVAHDDSLIRIGGFTATNQPGEDHSLHSQTSVARFDLATNAWTDLPALPESRSSLDAAVLGDTVYVFGGWQIDGDSDASVWHDTAWAMDLSQTEPQWTAIASPPFKRRAISVAAFHDKLYVIGGMQSEGGPTTRVDVYDPASDSWSLGPAIPGSGMSGFGSSSFAAGGELFVTTMDGFVHRLGGEGQAWQTIAKSEPARFFHRMLPEGDRGLLMIGGANMEVGKFTQIDRIQVR